MVRYQSDALCMENEIRAIKKLYTTSKMNRHIIEVFGIGRTADNMFTFIDMQLCDLSLDQYMKSIKTVNVVHAYSSHFSELQIWNIMIQIANGIAFIHSKGEIHRDIKPQNSVILTNASSDVNLVLYLHKDNT